MKRLKFGLATQIFLGLILGVAAGAIWFGNPAVATYLQPVGDLFLRLIKMIVIPIVVSSLIVGVAGAGSGKRSAGSAFGRSFTLKSLRLLRLCSDFSSETSFSLGTA